MAPWVVIAIAGAYIGLCLLAGFGPPIRLSAFQADGESTPRQFAAVPSAVVEAYCMAIRTTPGMHLVDESEAVLLVDLRPTIRVMGGCFGMAIRVHVGEGPAGTTVSMDWQKKVWFAFSNDEAAFVHAERALRMRAKRLGLQEVVDEAAWSGRGPADPHGGPAIADEVARRAVSTEVTTPPGWYADPLGRSEVRWWDGSGWTGHVRPPGEDVHGR